MPASSVTDRKCACNWFENAAAEPQIPVEYDAETNEFHLMYRAENGGFASMYHCPFCGGAAPESIRDSLFEHLSHEESLRLSELTKGLKTETDVVFAFGEPNEVIENGGGTLSPETETSPPVHEYFRSLRYSGLSETADVHVEVKLDGRAGFSFVGKFKDKTPSGPT